MSIPPQVKQHYSARAMLDVVHRHYNVLMRYGFTGDNTLACVGACRDELTRPLFRSVQQCWGEAFNFASLGGMLTLGKTGFAAATHHAPVERGRTRFVFYATVHIGCDEKGVMGQVARSGRGTTAACGALAGLLQSLQEGSVDPNEDDPDDIERVTLARRICERLEEGAKPDLVQLTRLALEVASGDLKRLIACTLEGEPSDYSVVTGTLIHTIDQQLFALEECYVVCDGKQEDLEL